MNIEFSNSFLEETKQLAKKYKLIKVDLKQAIEEIKKNDLGVYLGFSLYKKRVKNSSIPTGKSGGFRIIIYKMIEDKIVLVSIYSKKQKENLSDDELSSILQKYFKNEGIF